MKSAAPDNVEPAVAISVMAWQAAAMAAVSVFASARRPKWRAVAGLLGLTAGLVYQCPWHTGLCDLTDQTQAIFTVAFITMLAIILEGVTRGTIRPSDRSG